MSISTFQDKIFKSGCGVAVLVGCAAAMVMSMFYSCGRNQQVVQEEGKGPVALQIGDASIPVMDVEQQAQLMLAQQQGASGPKMEAMAMAQVLDQSVRQAASVALAKEVGADTSDAAIRDFVTKEIDRIVSEAKQTFIDSKKLKPNASAKEFDEVFKKERGQTPEEYRKSVFENITKSLSDPKARETLVANLSPQLALAKLKSTINPSDAEVRASYDTLVMKRVMISTAAKTPSDAELQANKALLEVKGGAKFEDVMNRYSNDLPPAANKKVGEVVINLNPSDIAQNASMTVLSKLKPGEISEVIDVPEGKAFYKLISVKSNAPKDIASNAKKYKEEFINKAASAEMQKRTDVIVKSDMVKFPLAGFKALRDYYSTAMDFTLMGNPQEFAKRIRAIADAAKAATTADPPADDHAALVTWYSAVDDLWNRAQTDKKALEALRAERVETLENVLRQTESFEVRMSLVDMGIEAKNSEMAVTNLIEASKLNNSFDVKGDQQFRDINAKVATLKIAKLITAEQVAELEKEQMRWKTEKASNSKAEAEFKAQQEAEKKKNEAATKAFDAEQKKMADQVKKDIEKNKKTPPATTGSTTTGTVSSGTTGGATATTGSR